MSNSNSPDAPTHSDPIPINSSQNHRTRPRSASETSDDSVPPLSPSQSPSSATSTDIPSPPSPSSRLPLSPVAPSSPILSYFYGSPTKSPFSRTAFSNSLVDGQYYPLAKYSLLNSNSVDEEPQDPSPTSAHSHSRRMSSSWIPVRFGAQQQQPPPKATERGDRVLRRLSLTGLTGLASQVRSVRLIWSSVFPCLSLP